MKATCPVCGYYGAIEGFLQNEDYKKALAIICDLPGDLPRLMIQYLSLFRKPGTDRALTGNKVLKICTEVGRLVLNKDLQWKNKRILENRSRYWMAAMTTILDKAEQGRLERPLENNNLLRAIAYDIAEKSFEKALREREERLRYRPDEGVVRSDGEQEAKRPLSREEALKRIKAIRAMLKERGKDGNPARRLE